MSVEKTCEKQKSNFMLSTVLLSILAGALHLLNAAIINERQLIIFFSGVEVILFGLISFSLAKHLVKANKNRKNSYHLSVIIPILLSIGFVLILNLNNPDYRTIPFLVLSALSSFLGSFILSNINHGWWENNAQPSRETEKAVLMMHQAHMGALKKTGVEKRLFDIFFALISLVLAIPIGVLIVFLIWWEDPGSVLFVKNSVGRGGKNFKQLKFRSMIINAEKDTGPISGYENDERVLAIGLFLRKTALDELPQLFNILIGDMSYVGPRPQRTVLVENYLQRLPLYAARHRVRPGLAGLAQVADTADISPEQKLAWDLVYIERANLLFDIKLALAAFYLVFILRWRHDERPEEEIRSLLKLDIPDHS